MSSSRGHRTLSAAPGRPVGPRLAVTVALCSVLLTGCFSSKFERGTAYDASDARWVFAAGFDNIESHYVDAVDMSDIATAAVDGLAKIDHELKVERRKNLIEWRLDNGAKGAVRLPEKDDPVGWANLTASVLEDSRPHSPALALTPVEEIYQAVFDNALKNLDSFSRYASAEEATDQRAVREGFGGIGVTIEQSSDVTRIASILDKSPAALGGLKVGDEIITVGGQSIRRLSLPHVIRKMRGPVHTTLKLTVRRPSSPRALRFAIKRRHIVPPTVQASLSGHVGHIRVTGFNQKTARSLKSAAGDLFKQARKEFGSEAGLSGLVLDLRGNPGGLLDQAVAVADLFLEDGRIVSTRGRHPDSMQFFEAKQGDIARGLPMVVLINGSSASAAEIVAAALQDSGRAVLVGTSTFGKGSVQTVIRLPNDGEMHLTWAHFQAPSGYSIDRLGVMPTICTSASSVSGDELLAALKGGRLAGISDLVARREVDLSNDDQTSRVAQNCPGRRKGNGDLEMRIAGTVLQNAALHSHALHVAAKANARSALATDPAPR
ncbi:MAG: S41 family peptidase [Alphaproteobacteria bacterium]|nr:S41 family peptidase [Alphaproteobacteria bacterium]